MNDSLTEFCKRHSATPKERTELAWYLAYLRWRKNVEQLMKANKP